MSQQADKITDSIAAAMSESKSFLDSAPAAEKNDRPSTGFSAGSDSATAPAPAKEPIGAGGSIEDRLNTIIQERERIERDQDKLRGEAEQELKRIVPEIDSLQKQIENLRSRKQSLEGFLQRMAPKGAGEAASPSAGQAAAGGQSPSLRRASFG